MALPPIRNANVPGRYAQGIATGNALQQLREQRMDRMRQDQARNALGQLVGGNAQPNSLAQLAQADPGAAMQFQQFQAQQQQAASEAEERENAMSAVRIHAMLSQGQVEPAMQMLANVPDSPQKQQAMQALSQGDVQGAMGVIEPVIEGYTRMGVLEAPQKPQRPIALSPGARLVNPETGAEIARGGEKREGLINLRLPSGEIVARRGNDPEVDDLLAQGATQVRLGVQAATPAGLSEDFSAGETAPEQRALRDTVREAEGALQQSMSLLSRVQESPGAGGVSGVLVDSVGGLLGQIPAIGQGLESGFSQVVAGASPEEVERIRGELRRQVAQQLAAITGEESGRFTEQERAIAEQALKGLSPTASPKQIISAQKTAMRAQVRALVRAKSDLGGPPPFNPEDDQSINQFGEALMDIGFTEEEARELIIELDRSQRNPLLGGGNG